MDAELERRWRAGLPPFDGVTLTPADPLPLPALRLALLAIIRLLKASPPPSQLFRLKDWHEHDGYITKPEPTCWEELESWCASEEKLYAAGAGDTYVRVGVFPEDRAFYLRFYIEEVESLRFREGYGDLDLTGPPATVQATASILEKEGTNSLEVVPAKGFFDARYAG